MHVRPPDVVPELMGALCSFLICLLFFLCSILEIFYCYVFRFIFFFFCNI